jgi:hypothetical protein
MNKILVLLINQAIRIIAELQDSNSNAALLDNHQIMNILVNQIGLNLTTTVQIMIVIQFGKILLISLIHTFVAFCQCMVLSRITDLQTYLTNLIIKEYISFLFSFVSIMTAEALYSHKTIYKIRYLTSNQLILILKDHPVTC